MTQFNDSIPGMASLSDTQDWLILRYPGIFEKIMLMIGLDSLESLTAADKSAEHGIQ